MNILLTQMLAQADPSQVAGLARFFKTGPGQYGEGDQFLGIKVPITRAVVKECWRQVGFPELEECLSSPYHEVRLAGLLALVEIFRHAGKGPRVQAGASPVDKQSASCQAPTGHPVREACVDFYLAHTAGINNWDLVDLSCYPLLGEWLLDKDRSLLYDLARHGKTLWEQRIGIVSTMTFIRHGQLQDTFEIADILLYHPHDLIHKAVGWLLREAGKRDKAALEAYLRGTGCPVGAGHDGMVASGHDGTVGAGRHPRHDRGSLPRYRSMPRTMLRYAIEKFPDQERKYYLNK